MQNKHFYKRINMIKNIKIRDIKVDDKSRPTDITDNVRRVFKKIS